jgi:hypothetical protein
MPASSTYSQECVCTFRRRFAPRSSAPTRGSGREQEPSRGRRARALLWHPAFSSKDRMVSLSWAAFCHPY